MKIGVLLREDQNKFTLNKEINDVINSYDVSLIGITKYDLDILKMLDGFIFQGGSDYSYEDLKVLDYLYTNNIPTLGICLGMQTMGIYKNGKLASLENHNINKKYVHEVKINKDSKLYDILKNDKIVVNSRHNDYLVKSDFFVCAKTIEGIIEAIEDSSLKFFIGVQWHPESLNDLASKRLFDAFFKSMN